MDLYLHLHLYLYLRFISVSWLAICWPQRVLRLAKQQSELSKWGRGLISIICVLSVRLGQQNAWNGRGKVISSHLNVAIICAKDFEAMSLGQDSILAQKDHKLWQTVAFRMSCFSAGRGPGFRLNGAHKSIAIDSFVNESADDWMSIRHRVHHGVYATLGLPRRSSLSGWIPKKERFSVWTRLAFKSNFQAKENPLGNPFSLPKFQPTFCGNLFNYSSSDIDLVY